MLNRILSLFKRQPVTPRIRDIRVLVVEDNPVDQKIVCNILKNMNYQIFTATNGEEGIKFAQTMKPHLVIMDCDMPVMNGWDAARALKENPATKNISVLFLTSLNTPRNIIDCFDLDAQNYLSKPVNAQILRTQIASVLKDFSNL